MSYHRVLVKIHAGYSGEYFEYEIAQPVESGLETTKMNAGAVSDKTKLFFDHYVRSSELQNKMLDGLHFLRRKDRAEFESDEERWHQRSSIINRLHRLIFDWVQRLVRGRQFSIEQGDSVVSIFEFNYGRDAELDDQRPASRPADEEWIYVPAQEHNTCYRVKLFRTVAEDAVGNI